MERSAQVAPARRGARRFAPPTALTLLLLVVGVVGLSWALLVPPFQAPDEPAHFAYSQSLAEAFRLTGNTKRAPFSTDQGVAMNAVGASDTEGYPDPSPPDWSPQDQRAYRAVAHSTDPLPRTDGSGFTSASGNPPLYYLIAGIPQWIDHGGTLFGRLYAVRIFGVLLLGLTALGAWLLAGEVFGRRRLAQLASASVAALVPMASFISTSVTPDALLMTTWTFGLWLGARVINHRARGSDVIALCAVTAAAILTKATSYALVAPAALAVLLGWWRRPRAERRGAVTSIAAGVAVLGVPILAWLALAPGLGGVGITAVGSSQRYAFGVRNFVEYVWQFYLPRLPFMHPAANGPVLLAYKIWIRQLIGDFGWLNVFQPNWLYPVVTVAAGLVAIAAVALLTRLRDRRDLSLLAFLGLAALALLTLLHITGYRVYLTGLGPFLQGRYLLPAIALFGLAVGLVVLRLPARVRPLACGALITALMSWQVISLATVMKAYYL